MMAQSGQNEYEDLQPAKSRYRSSWAKDDQCVWRLEVRKQSSSGSMRLGELILTGSFDGILTAKIGDKKFWEW
jgi:hypothetical protein